MKYIELRVSSSHEFKEILIAELGVLESCAILETDDGFQAYFEEEYFDPEYISYLNQKYGEKAQISFESGIVHKVNWNEEWEKNFDPVIIDEKCAVRASFHQPLSDVPFEIIINPKMSFGTGHHETTSLMISMQLKIDHKGKRVLDCGCGTGILSIFANKLKADSVTGIDTDDWAIENSIENAQLNKIDSIQFILGTIASAGISHRYDIILANINRNILLSEIGMYSRYLNPGGHMILSGFYSRDLEDIRSECAKHGFKLSQQNIKKDWVAAIFNK